MTGASPEQVNALLATAAPNAVVYLIAAGGCGVSGLGHLLMDLGYRVHGSDLVENEEVRQLRVRGAVIHRGHDAEHVRNAAPALVVYSSAIRSDNPEIVAARELKLPIVRRAVLLSALLQRKQSICVAGMHGKTTTASLLSYALANLGACPSYAIGAFVPQLPVHARFAPASPANLFVAEVDESDGTLREFRPCHAVVLNVDEEHLDYFANVQNVCREFQQFAAAATGKVVYCADDPRLAEIFAGMPNAVSFGYSERAHFRILPVALDGRNVVEFDISRNGDNLGRFATRLLGEKNLSNVCAAIALLTELGFTAEAIRGAILGFCGAARRQELLYADGRVLLFDDYGHHPNEIRATLRALRQLAPKRLVVAFQPHRYTRTLHLMSEFATAFDEADRLFLCDVYAASEAEIAGANSARLAELMRARGRTVEYVPEYKELPTAVVNQSAPGDVLLFIGAGSITVAAHMAAEKLREQFDVTNVPEAMKTSTELLAMFRAAVSAETVIHPDEPLSKRTTMRVGGKADFYIEPANESDLSAVLRVCHDAKVPFTIIGRGSNLLIRDGGIRGAVLCLASDDLSKVHIDGERLRCGAGAKLKIVAVEARRCGLAGLEFLEGIPGSVGGALRMNAGAMGSWMFEIVERIRFMDYTGQVHERDASEVNVEYRGCPLFKSHIALGAVLRGTPAPKDVIQTRAKQFNAKRWESQPAQPSAGCIFKNPATVPAGKLIDELGLKGTRRGGAMVSTVHGNFIVNEDNATARDVLELIDFIKQTARTQRGIELETEVEILGQ